MHTYFNCLEGIVNNYFKSATATLVVVVILLVMIGVIGQTEMTNPAYPHCGWYDGECSPSAVHVMWVLIPTTLIFLVGTFSLFLVGVRQRN